MEAALHRASSIWLDRLAKWAGLPLVAVTLVNEVLMGLVPGSPIWWSIPYFPIRAVLLPLLSVSQVVISLRLLWRGFTVSHLLVSASGVGVSVLVFWFCWFHDAALFFSPPRVH